MTNMQKYKIEITRTYCIDIEAKTEAEAQAIATTYLDSHMANRTEHYLESRDPEYTTYNVTDTEDPFNPLNK